MAITHTAILAGFEKRRAEELPPPPGFKPSQNQFARLNQTICKNHSKSTGTNPGELTRAPVVLDSKGFSILSNHIMFNGHFRDALDLRALNPDTILLNPGELLTFSPGGTVLYERAINDETFSAKCLNHLEECAVKLIANGGSSRVQNPIGAFLDNRLEIRERLKQYPGRLDKLTQAQERLLIKLNSFIDQCACFDVLGIHTLHFALSLLKSHDAMLLRTPVASSATAIYWAPTSRAFMFFELLVTTANPALINTDLRNYERVLKSLTELNPMLSLYKTIASKRVIDPNI